MIELFVLNSIVMLLNFYVAFAPKFRPMAWWMFNINIFFGVMNLFSAGLQLYRMSA